MEIRQYTFYHINSKDVILIVFTINFIYNRILVELTIDESTVTKQIYR